MQEIYPPNSVVHTVDKNKSEIVITNLEKFSLYEVMWPSQLLIVILKYF